MASEDAERIVGLYDRHAAAFDQQRGRNLFERAWLDRFLGVVRGGGAVLDLGCGMGEPIARYIIDRGYEVTGVDSSANMIRLCAPRDFRSRRGPWRTCGSYRCTDNSMEFSRGTVSFISPRTTSARCFRFSPVMLLDTLR